MSKEKQNKKDEHVKQETTEVKKEDLIEDYFESDAWAFSSCGD